MEQVQHNTSNINNTSTNAAQHLQNHTNLNQSLPVGTGKSTLIKAIQFQVQKIFAQTAQTPDTSTVLLCAPTGNFFHIKIT